MATQNVLMYTVNIEPVSEGGYFVSVPALPGCFTQGETEAEAIEMAADAIQGYLEALAKDGEPIPTESEPAGPFSTRVHVPVPQGL